MRKLALLVATATTYLCFAPSSFAQCNMTVDGEPSVARTGPNQARATATLFPTAIVGTWTVTLRAKLLFTPSGGSEQTVQDQPTSFTWTSSTPTGIGSSRSVTASDALESHGNGSYRSREEVSAVCGGFPFTISPKVSSSMAISRPAYPDYTVAGKYLTYMGGQSGTYTTVAGTQFSNTVALKVGATNGASGSATWDLIQSSPGYASLSCTSCTNPNLTANKESDGCLVYNVQVKTNYGGFRSEPLYVAIERPKSTIKPSSPPDLHEPVLGGGYLSQIFYETRGLCSGQGSLKGYSFNEVFSNIDNTVDTVTANCPSSRGA
ncbi:MAG: hypothetical protein GC160_15725 [Acidobacteria bacterium]|nr:hypothetical protein [Acidobacteriota bacterium]